MDWKSRVSPKTISRLSLYRRLLADCAAEQVDRVYSHELARCAHVSAAQVRRDIMPLGYSGTPNTGYDVQALIDNISEHIDAVGSQRVALVGVGNLGQALLSYFSIGRKSRMRVIAAFDIVPERTDRVFYGCRCYRVEKMSEIVQREQIAVGIIAVPAEAAQETAELLVAAGITGLLNFAPAPVKVPSHIFAENVDLAIKLETVAFFAWASHSP